MIALVIRRVYPTMHIRRSTEVNNIAIDANQRTYRVLSYEYAFSTATLRIDHKLNMGNTDLFQDVPDQLPIAARRDAAVGRLWATLPSQPSLGCQ